MTTLPSVRLSWIISNRLWRESTFKLSSHQEEVSLSWDNGIGWLCFSWRVQCWLSCMYKTRLWEMCRHFTVEYIAQRQLPAQNNLMFFNASVFTWHVSSGEISTPLALNYFEWFAWFKSVFIFCLFYIIIYNPYSSMYLFPHICIYFYHCKMLNIWNPLTNSAHCKLHWSTFQFQP